MSVQQLYVNVSKGRSIPAMQAVMKQATDPEIIFNHHLLTYTNIKKDSVFPSV